jgi:hypothetical protein
MPEAKKTDEVVLKGLNKPVKALDGKGIFRNNEGTPLPTSEQMKIGSVVSESLGRAPFQKGQDSVLAFRVANRVYDATKGRGTVKLDTNEHRVLVEAIRMNPAGYVPGVLGFVIEALEISSAVIGEDKDGEPTG